MATPISYTVSFTTPPDFTGRIIQGTKIVNIPDILNLMIQEDRDYFTLNIQNNFDGMIAPFTTFLEERLVENNVALKAEIVAEVALDNVTLYDINVTNAVNAATANNAALLEGKTVLDIITQAGIDLLPTASVNEAAHLQGQTVADILLAVESVTVQNATNAATLAGSTKLQLQEEIASNVLSSLSDATTVGGYTVADIIAEVKTRVETLYVAHDAGMFAAKTEAQWLSIITGTTVSSAVDSTTLGGKTLAVIEAERATAITAATDNYLLNYAVPVTAYIKGTVVDNAANSPKFDGDSRATWLATIAATVVNEALNASKFNNLTPLQWDARINTFIESNTNLLTTIQGLVNNTWKAWDSQTADVALMANDLLTSVKDAMREANFANLISRTQLPPADLNYISLNASTLEGNTTQDIIALTGQELGSNVISLASRGLINEYSEFTTAPRNVKDLIALFSASIADKTSAIYSDMLMTTFSDGNIDKHDASFFDPESLNVWSKRDITYNADGTKSKVDYYWKNDKDISATFGTYSTNPLYGYSATATTPPVMDRVDYDENSLAKVYGTGTIGETVTVTFRDATQATGVVDATGNWGIISTTPQTHYLDKVRSDTEDKLLTVDYSYTGGILTKKSISSYWIVDTNAIGTTPTHIYDIDYTNTFSGTPISTTVVFDTQIVVPFDEITSTTVETNYIEVDGTLVKEVRTTEITDPGLTSGVSFGSEIVFDREISFAAGQGIGDTADITYRVYNLSAEDITSVTISESDVGYTNSGTIATLSAASMDVTTLTATFVLTATEVQNGSLPDSVATLTGTDSSLNTLTRVNGIKNKIFNQKQTVERFALTNAVQSVSTKI